MSINVGAVQSADNPEPSSKSTVGPGRGGPGAFSALLQVDSDGCGQQIELKPRARPRESAPAADRRKTPEGAAAKDAGVIAPNAAALILTAQEINPGVLPVSWSAPSLAPVSAKAVNVSQMPLPAAFANEDIQGAGETQKHPPEILFRSMQDGVVRDSVNSDGGSGVTVLGNDVSIEAREPSSRAPTPGSAAPGPLQDQSSQSNANAARTFDAGAAEIFNRTRAFGDQTGANPAQIGSAPGFNEGDRSPSQQFDPAPAPSLPISGAESSGSSVVAAVSTPSPSAHPDAVKAGQNSQASDDSASGLMAQSGPQIAHAGAGTASQHRESSSASGSSGSGTASQRGLERGGSESPAFAAAAPSHMGAAVAQSQHSETQAGAPLLQPAMQHAFDANQAKALQNAMRDLRVNIQTESFGRVTVQAVTQSGELSAQLLLENSKQSAVLAAHLPALEQKLTQQYGMNASVNLDGGSGGSSGAGAGRHDADSRPGYPAEQRHSGSSHSPVVYLDEPAGIAAAALTQHVTSMLDVTV